MADFTLVVGVDTSLSFTEMQSGINEIVTKLNANPPKIKVKFDEAALKTMQSQLNTLQANINATSVKSPVSTSALADVATKAGQAATAVQNMNKAISNTGTAAKSAADAEKQLKNIADVATQARALLNKNMEASGSASYQKLNAELTKLEAILQACGGDSSKLSAALKNAGVDGEGAVNRLSAAMSTLKNELQAAGTQGTASLRQIIETATRMQALLDSNPQMVGTAQYAALNEQLEKFRGVITACKGDAAALESALHNAGLNGATAMDNAKLAMASFKAELVGVSVDTKVIVDGTTEYYNALSKVDKLLKTVRTNEQKWTAAKKGQSSESYQNYTAQAVALEKLSQKLKDGKMSVAEFNHEFAQIKSNMDTAATSISAAGENTKSLTNRISGLASKFTSWLGVSQAIMLAIRSIRQMVRESVELDSAMTQMQIVTKASSNEMTAFGEAAANAAKRTASAITDIVDSSTTYARLGYSMEDSMQLAEYTAMLQNVGDIDVSSAQDAITSIIKAFDIDASHIESVMDKLVETGNHFPISVSQIAEGMTNASSTLSAAGNSFEQSVALLTAANTTIQDAAKSSTGLRTITARIRDTKTELDDLGEVMTEASYEELVKTLTDAGVALTDINGEYRSTYDIMADIAAKWDTLDSMRQAAIATALSGNRQQAVFYSIIENFQEASGAMEAMTNSTGALSDAFGTYLDSARAHIDTLKTSFTELAATLIDSGFISGVVDIGTHILNILNGVAKLIQKLGGLKSVLVGIGSVAAIKNMSSITSFFDDLRGKISKTLSVANIFGNEFKEIFDMARVDGASSFRAFFTAARAGFSNLATAASVSVAAIAAVTIAIFAIRQHLEELRQEAAQASNDVANSMSSRQDSTERYIARITELKEKIDEGSLSQEELYNVQSELLSIQDELSDTYGHEADKINLLSMSAEEAADAISALNAELSRKESSEFLTKYDSQIDKATRKVEKVKAFINNVELGSAAALEGQYSAVWERMQEIIAKYDSASIGTSMVDKYGTGMAEKYYTLKVSADAKDAEETIYGLSRDFQELKNELEQDGISLESIFNFEPVFQKGINKVDKILDDWGEIYDNAQKAKIANNDTFSDIVEQFQDAEQAYKEAVTGTFDTAEERAKAIQSALQQMDAAKALLDDVNWTDDNKGVERFIRGLFDAFEEASKSEELKLQFKLDLDTPEKATQIIPTMTDLLSRFTDESEHFSKTALGLAKQEYEAANGVTEGLSEEAAAYGWLNAIASDYGMTVDDLISLMVELDYLHVESANAIDNEIASLATLQDELEGATQKLADYNTALSEGEKGDTASLYSSAFKGFVEDWDSGKTGTNRVRAAVELFIPDEVLRSLDYDLQAAGELLSSDMYRAIFNTDGDPGANFIYYLKDTYGEALDGIIDIVDNGDYIDFDVSSYEGLADVLGIDIDLVYALCDALDAYGTETLMSAEATQEMADKLGILDASMANIDKVQKAIDGLAEQRYSASEIKGVLDQLAGAGYIDTSGIENLGNMIGDAVLKIEAVDEKQAEPEITLNTPQFDSALAKANAALDAFGRRNVSATATVTTYYESVYTTKAGNLGGALTMLSGGLKGNGISGGGRAYGTPNAPGGKTLVNELGPELISENGKAYIAGDGSPTVVDLQPGAIVLDAETTRKALNGSKITAIGSASDGRIPKRTIEPVANVGGSKGGVGSLGTTPTYTGNQDGESWFEEQYKLHNHLIKMCQEDMDDYLTWLNIAFQQAYQEGVIELDDYRRYQEEVYNGLQELFNDYLSDVEHEIDMRSQFEGESKRILAIYKKLIVDIENEIAAARAAGLDDTDDYIQELQKRWADYGSSIKEIEEDATDGAKDAVDELVEYRIDMLKKDVDGQKDSLQKKLDYLKEFYQKQKEMLQDAYDEEKYLDEQSEKRKSVADIQSEMAQLEFDDSAWARKRMLQLQEELNTAQKELDDFEKQHALDEAIELLDNSYDMQEKSIDAEMDALDAKLNDPEALYNKALSDIRNNTQELYDAFLMYNRRYGTGNDDDVISMWEAAYKAMLEYSDVHGGDYNGINLGNYTGYERPAESWDSSPVSGANAPSQPSTAPVIIPTQSSVMSYPYGKASDTTGDIGEGAQGQGVQAIQYALNQLGYGNSGTSSCDGVFGSGTRSAVASFQSAMGISADGIVGVQTRSKFKAAGYASGTRSAAPGLHSVDELGAEYLFTSADGNKYRVFSGGEKVLNARATDFLYNFATAGSKVIPSMIADSMGGIAGLFGKHDVIGEINMGDIIIHGNADERTVSEIRRAQRESVDFMLKELNRLKK